jgi:hypothetical protein
MRLNGPGQVERKSGKHQRSLLYKDSRAPVVKSTHPIYILMANEVACQLHRRFPDAENDNGRNVCDLN